MRLRAKLERPGGDIEDILIGADPGATVQDLARSIVTDDPRREYGDSAYTGDLALEVRATDGSHDVETFDGRDSLEDLQLGSGVQLRVVPQDAAPRTRIGVLAITEGPDHGVQLPLYRGTSTVGRADDCDVVVADTTVSKLHARIHAAADRIEVVDLNSANGVLLGDALVPRADVTDGTPVTLGATTLVAHLDADAERPSTRIQERSFTRAPRVELRYPARELDGASLPVPPEKQPFPWLMVLLPVIVGAGIFALTRSPYSLIFIAMSPMMMLGTYVTGNGKRKRQLRQAIETFESQMERLAGRLDKERALEHVARNEEIPALQDVDAAAREVCEPLWTRRPEHWSFMFARLGVGAAPSRVTVKAPDGRDRALPEYEERFDALVERYHDIPDVPIVENLAAAGALGIAGPARVTASYARGLVGQMAGLHSPAEVALAAVVGPQWAEELAPMKWLPHADSGLELLGAAFGASPQGALDVVSRIEELIASRSGGKEAPVPLGALSDRESALRVGAEVGETHAGSPSKAPRPALLVLIGDDAPIERSRLIQLMERAAQRGVYPVWLTDDAADLPAACRTFVTFDDAAAASAHFVRLGRVIEPMQVEGFSARDLEAFSMGLARVADAGAVSESASDLPTTVPMLDLLGRDLAAEPDAVVDRWRQNGSIVDGSAAALQGYAPRLRALVGQGSAGALHIDLRGDGPHALVGGTTGAGKSEFLQAWVLGMAAEYSPQRVTFLFVDYKGGSAFADCTQLPHCVGLVTDLSPHLVRRALVSLRAELHYREELLNRKKAKDILALEKTGDPECPPALVIVIDEFAALVNEVPDFVDGVVDIAQRGRSLGIHLIMATQRPAGVIRDNLRANTNLRVALRMADESDSLDVIGDKAAAQFPPELPGRAMLKSGPGRLTAFQSAYAGGRSFEGPTAVHPNVATFAFGPAVPWERPAAPSRPSDEHASPTDQQRLVATIVDGGRAARVPEPRRPWLDELPETVELDPLTGGSDARLPLGLMDIPQHQQQAPVFFDPDADQNLAIYGASGSGKTSALRTLATAAGFVDDGAVHVYGLDAGGTGLRMLEALPHVGSVVAADDPERVTRLMRMLRALVEERTARYGAVSASTLAEYREHSARPQEPRVLLLVDNLASFRGDYDGVPGRSEAFDALQFVMQEGRSVGVHAVVTADRAATISNAMQATMQKRLILRLSDKDGYSPLGVPRDVLTAESAAGRGLLGSHEVQVALLGGLTGAREMAEALVEIAPTLPAARRDAPEPVRSLPTEYSLADLPERVDGRPVIGLSDVALAPHTFEPHGTVLIAGGPESGRSTALMSLAQSLRRFDRDIPLFYLGGRRSALREWAGWSQAAIESSGLAELDAQIEAAAAEGRPLALFIEHATDLADTPSDQAIVAWLRRAKQGDLLVVAESETMELGGYGTLKTELRAARRGIVLQPETPDGDAVLKTSFPRIARAEFTPGRGMWAASGKVARMQLPLPLDADDASVAPARPLPTSAGGAATATEDADATRASAGPEAPAAEPAAASKPALPDWAVAPGRE